MKIDTKYDIGDAVNLFGYKDWTCVITAITVRASGQVEYQLEWDRDGEPKSEWFEEKRLELLNGLYGKPTKGEESEDGTGEDSPAENG